MVRESRSAGIGISSTGPFNRKARDSRAMTHSRCRGFRSHASGIPAYSTSPTNADRQTRLRQHRGWRGCAHSIVGIPCPPATTAAGVSRLIVRGESNGAGSHQRTSLSGSTDGIHFYYPPPPKAGQRANTLSYSSRSDDHAARIKGPKSGTSLWSIDWAAPKTFNRARAF